MRGLVVEGFEAVRSDVTTLKERARTWGALAGLITSGVVVIVAGIVLKVIF